MYEKKLALQAGGKPKPHVEKKIHTGERTGIISFRHSSTLWKTSNRKISRPSVSGVGQARYPAPVPHDQRRWVTLYACVRTVGNTWRLYSDQDVRTVGIGAVLTKDAETRNPRRKTKQTYRRAHRNRFISILIYRRTGALVTTRVEPYS